MNVKDIGEIALIKRLTRGMKLDSSVVKGPGDDTAVIKWDRNTYLLYTCDMLVEDIHFKLSKATPAQIGWKALGRNISDIAAMGGVARYAVVSMALPPCTPVLFADGVYRGMRKLAGRFGVNIVGGDISRSEKIIIDISLIGEVEKNNLVTRSGALAGDAILVTGLLGGSLKGKHLDFMPRLRESRALVKGFTVHSMIDVSDGLLLDLSRLLDASGVGAEIYRAAVPLSPDALSFNTAVRDGEDFELLFTMGEREAQRFIKKAPRLMRVPVSIIGNITSRQRGYRLVDADGKMERIPALSRAKGYVHFL